MVEVNKRVNKRVLEALGNVALVEYGGDPEFFILDEKGVVIPSDTIIPDGKGSKAELLNDGVQAELNYTPSNCRDIIVQNIRSGIKDFSLRFQELKYRPTSLPITTMSKDILNNLSPECKTFGCSIDYNVYNGGEANIKEFNGAKLKIRFAGGHIHIGSMSSSNPVRELIKKDKGIILTKLLDLMVAVPLVEILDEKLEKERRKYFGQAGDFRLPTHGLEYRTLSSAWLIHPAVTSLAYGLVKGAVNIYKDGLAKEVLKLVEEKDIIDTINNSDKKKAAKIMEIIKPYIFFNNTKWHHPLSDDSVSYTIWNGLKKHGVLKVFGDNLYKNWGVKNGSSSSNTDISFDNTFLNGFIKSRMLILNKLIELNQGGNK